METTNNTPKFSFEFYMKNAKKCYHIAKRFLSMNLGNWSTCLKMAWRKIRAFASGVVVFQKRTKPEIRTAKIAPLSDFDFEFSGSEEVAGKIGLVRCIDLEKLNNTGHLNSSIISFYLQDICV
jgi:hypothetical protein